MSRLILYAAGVVLAAIILMIGFIHTQPRDEVDLHAFLLPDDNCPAACFMGIQPGKTTAQNAIAILQAHPWVAEVKENDYGIAWIWSGAQSPLIDSNHSGHITIDPQGKVIANMSVYTNISMANVWLVLGMPQMGGIDGFSDYQFHTAYYMDRGLMLYYDVSCPLSTQAYWSTPVQITFFKPVTKSHIQEYALPTRDDCYYDYP
jgi:hypothetical protein